jgi:hypothetical protein
LLAIATKTSARSTASNTVRPGWSLLLLVVLSARSSATTYTATLLHPAGLDYSLGWGTSNDHQVGYGRGTSATASDHALLWSGTAASVVDLNPNDSFASYATAVAGSTQVGWGTSATTGNNDHAFLWQGTAESAVDLHPIGFERSEAIGVSGTSQVGYAANDSYPHAILWTGTPASAVDLNPTGFDYSIGSAVSGTKQVGYGAGTATGNKTHALLWSGTKTSKVDLNPTGFDHSYAYQISGTTQVGYGAGTTSGGNDHALLWHNTSASAVDLNPSGFSRSTAFGVSSAGQVGYGNSSTFQSNAHAVFWNGTATSAVDLHTFLNGLGFNFTDSTAYGISDSGAIIGTATVDDFFEYAVLWTPVVESGIAGDYNNNGDVDAADYATWRKGNTTLHNEVTTPDSNTPGDYTEWRARFGNPAGSGATLSSEQVPEPAWTALVAWALVLAVGTCARRHRLPLLTR